MKQALAPRVPLCHTYVIIPRNPPSDVTFAIMIPDIRAVGIHADIVGAADITIQVSRFDSIMKEAVGTAVSASVWPRRGQIVLSRGNP